jgi:hypothetical protein
MRWPGRAAVDVVLLAIHKGKWDRPCELDGKVVPHITSYLDSSAMSGEATPLIENKDKSFQGSIVCG